MHVKNSTNLSKRFLLLFAALASASALCVDLDGALMLFSKGMKPYYVNAKGENASSGKFYGYQNAATGPGDDAFQIAKDWVDDNNAPLVVVFDTGSSLGNSFAADMNDDTDYQGGRYLLQWTNGKAGPSNYNCVFTYFKGGTTSPAACKDAYDFCQAHGGGANFPIVVCYWKWADGTVKTATGSSLSSVGAFESVVNAFLVKNKPPANLAVLPKGSAGFAAGGLEAEPGTGSLFVPFVRTNNLNAAETNWLVAGYPDGTASTNEFAWAAGDEKAEVQISAGTWASGKEISLTLLNTNAESIASSAVAYVAASPNSLLFPYAAGEKDSLAPGEWTLDFAAATNAALAANSYLLVETNALEHVVHTESFDWSTSNRYDTVATDDLSIFAKLGETPGEEASAEAVATNTTKTCYVESLSKYLVDSSVTNAATVSVEVPCAYYGVVPAADGGAAETNLWLETTLSVSAEVLSVVETRYALADEGHPADTEVVETNIVSKTVTGVGTNFYHIAVTEYAAAGEPVVKDNFSFAASNSVSYVFGGGAVTNLDGTAYTIVATNVEAAVTNFVRRALSRESGTATIYGDVVERVFDIGWTDFHYSVETNEHQRGAGESRAFVLAVPGGVVWDDSLRAFAGAVAASTNFTAWCEANNVYTAIIDEAEPGTGASLTTWATASNGVSGASWLSRKGRREGEGAGDAASVPAAPWAEDGAAWGKAAAPALLRPDGSVVGWLSVQSANSAYDVAENLARLGELLALAEDVSEGANDYPGSKDLPELAYGGEGVSCGLSVNDKADWFALTGVAANTAVAFEAVAADGAPTNASVAVTAATADGAAVEPKLPGVWVFTEKEVAAGIRVGVHAYGGESAAEAAFGGKSAFDCSVVAKAAPENAGAVGFKIAEDGVLEGTATNYLIRLERSGGLTGVATATVSLSAGASTCGTNRYEWAGDAKVTWGDCELGEKAVSVGLVDDTAWDGDGTLAFTVAVEGAVATNATFTLKYYEDEVEDVGRLAIAETAPGAAVNGLVYVRSGGEATVYVDRLGGSCSNVTGVLTASAADAAWITGRTLEWPEKDQKRRFATLAAPGIGTKAYLDFTVTLSGEVAPVDGAAKSVRFRTVASDAPEFATNAVAVSGVQYASIDTNAVALVSVPAGWAIRSLARIAGALPKGVAVSVNRETGALEVKGVPTAGAATSATYWVQLASFDGRTVYSLPVEVSFDVKALADVNGGFEAARSWTGLPLLAASGDGGASRLSGLLDLTVAKTGRTSARYRRPGGRTVAFSSAGLTAVDAESGEATVEMAKTAGGLDYSLSVALGADGSLEATVVDPEYGSLTATVAAGAKAWGRDWTAAAWGGAYTAAFALAGDADDRTLCTGAATLRVKFDTVGAWRTGRAVFAGTLPNGKSVSGSATFVPVAEDAAADGAAADLPVFAANSAETFGALLSVATNGTLSASEGTTARWAHNEAGIESLSYANDYGTAGGAYAARDWSEAWTEEYGTNVLAFAVDGADSGARISASGAALRVADKGGVSFGVSLNRTSGVAAGSFRSEDPGTGRLSTAAWRGVALPGAEGDFIEGAYWRSASKEYEGAGGVVRRRSVRVGGAVSASAAE